MMAMQAPEKILIVDDEPDIAQIIKLYLEEAGFVTAWAGDGDTAIHMLLDTDYALVLLDIRMPKVSGVEVLRHIRTTGSSAAVIMMTGHGNEELAVECMKSGAVDYFPKPFDLVDMHQRVERAVTHRRTLLEIQRLEREKEYFHSMMSHDMKNPMTAAIGSIDIIREGRLGPVNEEQKEYLQAAIDSCNEVLAMINNLLDVQRFAAGKMQVIVRPYDPAEIITTAAVRFTHVAEHEGISLALNLEKKIPDIAVDRNAFSRVLGNLLGNALKFTPEGGAITVSCCAVKPDSMHKAPIPSYVKVPKGFRDQACFVRVSVKDTGSGILSEDLSRIFEPYTQSLSINGRERGGAGLGLAFCRMAVESFGGIIWAESETEKGSEFIILLPCYAETVHTAEAKEERLS
jgi:two-component system sensor histidine kinase/response regulator